MGRRTVEENGEVVYSMGLEDVAQQIYPSLPDDYIEARGLIVPKDYHGYPINLVAGFDGAEDESKYSLVNDPMLGKLIDELGEARKRSAKKVIISISTFGGLVDTAMGIVGAIDFFRHQTGATVTVLGLGKVMSAGAYILQGASEGQRIINDAARILIHPMKWGVSGDRNQIEFETRVGISMEKTIKKKISERSGLSMRKVNSIVNANGGMGTSFTSVEALKLGLVDQVIEVR